MKTTTTVPGSVVRALTKTVEELAQRYEEHPDKANLKRFSAANEELQRARRGEW